MNHFDWEPEINIIRFAATDVITTSALSYFATEEDETNMLVLKFWN